MMSLLADTKPLTLVSIVFLLVSVPIEAAENDTKPQQMPNIGIETALSASTYPYLGKLTFTDYASAQARHCTAAFVANNVLITAAHCIQFPGSGGKNTNFAFTQEGGQNFTIMQNCVKSSPDYLAVNNVYLRVNYDYGFLKTTTSVSGSPGPKGLYTGDAAPFNKDITLYGYPGISGPLAYVPGTTRQDILHPTINSFKTNNLNFTLGTSGGPWIIEGSEKILSINSSFAIGLYNPAYLRIYGPIFDDSAVTLQNTVQACM
jgi:Trypsin